MLEGSGSGSGAAGAAPEPSGPRGRRASARGGGRGGVEIVAEIANNHGGDLSAALHLVEQAARAGASSIKGQIGISELCAPSSPFYTLFRKLELSEKAWDEVRARCSDLGIPWSASVWSERAAEYVGATSAPWIKVGSGDATWAPTLRAAAKTGKPILLSVGGCSEDEVRRSVDVVGEAGGTVRALLACTMSYPCVTERAHLSRMRRLDALRGDGLIAEIGYSSHCKDVRVAAYAADLGATVLEQHVYLGGDEPDPGDGSVDPATFARLVDLVKTERDEFPGKFRWEAYGPAEGLAPVDVEVDWLRVARRNPATGVRE